MDPLPLILASASPRRRELLDQIGVHFQTSPADICELPRVHESAHEYTARLAREKAQTVFARQTVPCAVLGSDTTVAIDGDILGKPADEADAVTMLMRLSGRVHEVMTAVALCTGQGCDVQVVTSRVEFIPYNEALCRRYWRTGEPADKAGAYGIQGAAGMLVRHIEGSYSAIVGLPLCETAALLSEHGIPVWQFTEQEGSGG